MKLFIKHFILFLIFGTIYFILESIWKGHLTHWTMFCLAGLIGVAIGSINEYIPWEMPFLYQSIIGMIVATVAEGLSGLILNVWLQLNIWDYSHTFGHFFFNQCSIPFCAIWLLLAAACIVIDDYIRWKFFNEKFPNYIFL